MWKKVLYLFTGSYLCALLLLGILVYRASPGPTAELLQGVGIGGFTDDVAPVYLSGRRLNCRRAPLDGSPIFTCAIEIAGQRLVLEAERFQETGTPCRASYAGKTWPCLIGSRHVHVHQFAYLTEPLGLSTTEIAALRRAYLFENLPERYFLSALLVIPVATMVVSMVFAIVWLVSNGYHWRVVLLRTLGAGTAALLSTFIITFTVTNGFWD